MRDSSGRGQRPGRGAGGAGSQGGPGAARRTPGGPGRAGRGSARSEGAGRPASPDDAPRPPRKRPDPLDLPFGQDDSERPRPPQDPSSRSRGGDRADGPRGAGRSDRSRGADRPAASRGGDRADEPRGAGRSAASRGGDGSGRPRGRGDDSDRARPRPDSGERDRARPGSGERDRARPGSGDRDRARSGSADGARPGAGSGRTRPRQDPGDRARPREGSGRADFGMPDLDAPRPRRDAAPGRAEGGSRPGGADGPSRGGRDRSGARAEGPRGAQAPAREGRQAPEGRRAPAPGHRRDGEREYRRDGERERPAGRSGGDGPPPRGPRRPPTPPRPPRPPLVLRLGNPRRRINIGLIGMTFILSIFAGRLIQMQGIESKVYEAAAVDQRTHTEEIPAKRGSITDVNGHALAVTVEAREISIDPSKVPLKVRDKMAAILAQQLGKPQQEIAAKLARVDTRYQLLARDVDPVVAARLLQARVPALYAKKTYRRLYPAGDLAGSLIGFVGDDGDGLGGMEQTKNTLLAGRDGKQRVETGRGGQRIPMTSSQRTPPVNGRDVRLTIDRDIQWAAQKAIADEVRKSGAASGTVIVMDVRTAQIIAMANAPELDLTTWRTAPDSLYVNKAASEVFEPGSTNKVITAAAALEARTVTPDTVFRVPDNIRCADRVLRDAHPHKTESMTFRQAMAQSSNVATIMAARKIGRERLYQMLRSFGFGTSPGGGVPGAEAGLLPDYKTWSGSQNCTVAYGQGVSVTALQMASVYQTIANGGVKIDPQIVAGTTDDGGRFVPSPAGKQTRVVSETTAKEIATMLESAVSAEGTGELAAIPGYRVAGKTGTANRYDPQLGRYEGYTASFVGFAPADAPRLVVLSVLQNPKNGHYGGQIAAPVFKDVMTFAIKSKKIPPTGSAAPPVRPRAGQ
ncbi:penicillin-binding transpeptidase domain-containing protein [Nonomuraea pusilla]|uniref:penicillin-binding transpeptidase domain-containing protein n=1 Tax=Nonomuraea pusilla TaxID=46177 RepID=UPI00331E2A02